MKAHWKRLYGVGAARIPAGIEFGDGRLDLVLEHAAHEYECGLAPDGKLLLRRGDEIWSAFAVRRGDEVWVHLGGRVWSLRLEKEVGRRAGAASAGAGNHELRAPMVGTVRAVQTHPGDQVASGQPLLIVEAMKMEHVLKAPRDGQVASVQCAVGDLVDLGQVLLRLAPDEREKEREGG